MKTSITFIKEDNLVTLNAGFATVLIDLNNVAETIDTIKGLASFFGESLPEINKLSKFIKRDFERVRSILQGYNLTATMEIDMETKRINYKDMVFENGFIDLNALLYFKLRHERAQRIFYAGHDAKMAIWKEEHLEYLKQKERNNNL
jgi:hypothetical protein